MSLTMTIYIYIYILLKMVFLFFTWVVNWVKSDERSNDEESQR